MTNEIHVNEILANYTEEEQKIIAFSIQIRAFVGIGGAPQTDAEFKAFCDETLAEKKAEKEKEERTKQRRIENEKRRADENGMTVEEYRVYKKLQAKKKRYAKEIAEFEKEIEKLQKAIAWKKKFIEEN